MAPAAGRRVALLRGVNVNGRRLAMSDLAAACERAGCREVETFIQSGNVLFAGGDADEGRMALRLREAIARAAGFDVPVVLRTADELAALVAEPPFADARGDDGLAPGPDALHVTFLASAPDALRVAALDAQRASPDRFAVRGRDVVLWCPGGYGRTKLTTAYFDKALGVTSTCRNWKTTLRLAELARG